MTTFTHEQIAAAQLRIVLDQKLGRDTPGIIRRIAAMTSAASSNDGETAATSAHYDLPDVPEQKTAVSSDETHRLPPVTWRRHDEAAAEERQQVVSIAESADDMLRAVSALTSLGSVYAETGRHDDAIAALRQVVSIAESADDRMAAARALTTLGTVYAETGRHDDATAALQQALSIAEDSTGH